VVVLRVGATRARRERVRKLDIVGGVKVNRLQCYRSIDWIRLIGSA
jgi:hypothetical protein